MDETPAPEALDQRRRRLLFRATHRGTRENDILFGGFVTVGLAEFTDADLAALEGLLEVPDPLLADWLQGREALPSEPPILRRIREAALRKEAVLF